jgi:hypothetical protein
MLNWKSCTRMSRADSGRVPAGAKVRYACASANEQEKSLGGHLLELRVGDDKVPFDSLRTEPYQPPGR